MLTCRDVTDVARRLSWPPHSYTQAQRHTHTHPHRFHGFEKTPSFSRVPGPRAACRCAWAFFFQPLFFFKTLYYIRETYLYLHSNHHAMSFSDSIIAGIWGCTFFKMYSASNKFSSSLMGNDLITRRIYDQLATCPRPHCSGARCAKAVRSNAGLELAEKQVA